MVAAPALPDAALARLTPPAPLRCNSGRSIAIWTQVEKHFIWDEAITAMLKVAWKKLCADRYANFTYRMRSSSVSQEIWESWQKAWEDPAFKRKREIFAQNRRSETGGDGAGPSRNTGGSISAIKTSRLLDEKLGREPTPIEVFTYTHTKDHDLNTFVDRRAVSVNENYTTARERIVTSQTDESEAKSRIDEVALYLEVVGGEKKRKLSPEHSAEELTELRARVDDQQRQIAELRAHVMRLSGEPGAGTFPLILCLLQIEMFRHLSSSHFRLLIPMLQTIPWSPLPALQHIQQVLL
ncbi:hypothetical protein JCGZ_00175 [Jatropha curcas]|uniref:Uncharacterized protein n=1 Tax=Jatropha curcas TaxID=180498 RepID=A0A067L2I0_JATCU|nr:hypothetical protein JCGZ_00175 [Jatropha curcas]